MKTLSISSLLYILGFSLFLGLLSGCRKEVTIALPIPTVEGEPSGATMTTKSVKVEGSKVEFTVDLYVVNKNGRFVTGLQKDNFSIAAASGRTYQIEKVELFGLSQISGGYSALMLFDQSGSIASTDPRNLRIEAGKTFLDHLGYNDNAAIASFTASYPSNQYPNYTKFHNEFSRDTTYMKAVLDTLSRYPTGGTPLYHSVNAALDFAESKAKNSNKAVIVFTDGEDNMGGNINDVINYAKTKKLPLFTVGLSRSVDVGVLSRMASETGGAFFWAQNAKQLISSFSTLGRLLANNTHLYRTTWSVEKSSGEWKTGDTITATIKITLPSGEIVDSPFWVKL